MTKKLPIIVAPNPILKQKAQKVSLFDEDFLTFLDQITYTTVNTPNCGGLSAPQVGSGYHAFIMNMSTEKKGLHKIINGEILKYSEEKIVWTEGCLSFPDVWLETEMSQSVVVKYMDEHGKTHEKSFEDGEACCVQHELNHLKGILMIDRLSKDRQDFILRKIIKTKV